MSFKRVVYDIETDEIKHGKVSKLHCIVMECLETGEVRAYHDTNLKPWDGSLEVGVGLLAQANVVAGHNIKQFDEPALEWLRPDAFVTKPNRVCIDTIALSRLLYPNRFEHSLESWAKTLKTPQQKIQNDEWDELTQVVLTRCVSDVKINTRLLRYLQNTVTKHSAEGTDWMPALWVEQDVAKIHAEQVACGVYYDVVKAIEAIVELDKMMKEKSEYIIEMAPFKLESPGLTDPKLIHFRKDPFEFHKGVVKPFKKNGDYSVNTITYFAETTHDVETVQGPYSKIEFVPLNINSDTQIKRFLHTLGWKPDEWNTKKLPDGSYRKTSPKLSETSFGSLPRGIGQDIKDYRTMKHRRGLIQSPNDNTKGALAKVRPDQRVSAQAITCGTPTTRYRHSGAVCNIPRPSSPYGAMIRALYGCHPDNWQVGIDLEGIEARMLAHFCYHFTNGKAFAELVTEGDWHTENSKLWSCSRDDAKTELYALMYNAGPQKLGNILGKPASVGRMNKNRFMQAYTPYAELVETLEHQLAINNGFIYGLDGRRFYVRHKKDVLNTCLQGNSAILFKHWMVDCARIRKESPVRIEQIIAYHDELQNEVFSPDRGVAEAFGEDVCSSALRIGEKFNINVPITAEAKVGKSWAECH